MAEEPFTWGGSYTFRKLRRGKKNSLPSQLFVTPRTLLREADPPGRIQLKRKMFG